MNSYWLIPLLHVAGLRARRWKQVDFANEPRSLTVLSVFTRLRSVSSLLLSLRQLNPRE